MRLITKYFDCIKKGSKTIELRLNDEKRRNIKIGDEIVFEELNENPRYLRVRVIDLYYEKHFEDLINKFDIKLFADESVTKEEILSVLNEIYTKENQDKYGVVGIKIQLLDN